MFSVLIVDDHKHLVESLATTVPWENYRIASVYSAYSGKQALQVMMEKHIDILLTDIRMPQMSGLELIGKVRELELETECVLLTGYAEFQYAKQAVELQAVRYLLKPVRDDELQAVLLTIMEKLLKRNETMNEAELAARQERRRIARDLHDILGYTLTGMLVNLETAKMLIRSDREEGLRRLELSSELLRNGMISVRSAVHVIEHQNDEADLVELLLAFLAETERLTGAAVTISIEAAGAKADPAVARALVHAVQEGITNAIRHGQASRFLFRLQQDEQAYVISLWNNGRPYEGEAEGIGLQAMRERIGRWGGTVTIAATVHPSGTLLTLRIPS